MCEFAGMVALDKLEPAVVAQLADWAQAQREELQAKFNKLARAKSRLAGKVADSRIEGEVDGLLASEMRDTQERLGRADEAIERVRNEQFRRSKAAVK